jgi:nicotinamide mononucleotide transporter
MISSFIAQNWIEITAMIFAILYLVLAVKQNILCWIAGIISSAFYFFIFHSSGLDMDAYLQIFYVSIGFYGWSQWKSEDDQSTNFIVNIWSKPQHLAAISMILVFSLVSGWLLESYTNAALPFLDALVTWGAVVATYMVAKKVLENWIYWFVIDTISIFLFVARDLWITALLFMIYIVIILFGYRSWKKVHNESNSTTG